MWHRRIRFEYHDHCSVGKTIATEDLELPKMSKSESTRRVFIRNGTLFLLGAGAAADRLPSLIAAEPNNRGKIRIGLATDMHYADKPPGGSRHYRETLEKLAAAANKMDADQPDLMVELGDMIDSADNLEAEKEHLERIHEQFVGLPGEKHYVLGNHCVHTLTKEEFLSGVGQEKSYYSFDHNGFHFVVLDSCFRSDGEPYGRQNFKWTDANIPAAELEWLRADLEQAEGKTIVFAHQRLDVENNHGVKNCKQVRAILEDSGKVLAVLQGHSHKNDYQAIGGIHYCVLVAMVEGSGAENNGCSTMDLFEDGSIRISGFQKQQSYDWG